MGRLMVMASALAVSIAVLAAGSITQIQAIEMTGWEEARLYVRHATVGDTSIAYAELGPHSGPALLMINGTASPMSDWDPALLQALGERGHRVIVFDYPGLGRSGPIERHTSFNDLADISSGLLANIGVQSADVLGWSMGGFVAQRMLLRHPSALRKVVLAATNPGGPEAVLGPEWVQRIDSDPEYSLKDYVRTNFPVGTHHQAWNFIHRVNTAQEFGWYPPSRTPARTTRIMVEAERPWLRHDTNLAELASVDTPVLVITGREDRVTPKRNSRILATALPNAGLVLWPDAGHSFLFQAPLKVAKRVSAFLSQ